MDERMDEYDDQNLLSAFADGELDAVQEVRALRYLVDHPDMLPVVERNLQLRAAARRAVVNATPATPKTVRDAILRASFATDAPYALAEAPAETTHQHRDARPDGRRWPAMVATAAVALIVGTLVGRSVLPNEQQPAQRATGVAGPIPVTLVTSMARDHVDCSALAIALHSQPFPVRLGTLAKSIETDLHGDRPYPDFSSVGYAIQGAGECEPPLSDTVHLLYRSTDLAKSKTLSLFVQPFTGQFQIEPAKVYLLQGGSKHPMLLWRSDAVVYVLVGNDLKTIAAARDGIGGEQS